MPWARPDAHHTRDFENVVAWLAQQMAKTQITRLLRIGWSTVGRIVTRVVADQLDDQDAAADVVLGGLPRRDASPGHLGQAVAATAGADAL